MPRRPTRFNIFYWYHYVKLDGCKIHIMPIHILIFTQRSYDHVPVYSSSRAFKAHLYLDILRVK